MCSLTERVNLLESMLQDNGTEPPPANHPPMTRHGPRPDDPSPSRKDKKHSTSLRPASISNPDQSQSSPGSQEGDMLFESEIVDRESPTRAEDGDSSQSAPSPGMLPPPKKDGMISRLLSTRGHLSFDQLSGRLRYFGPTANSHIHSEFGNHAGETRESLEQARRAEKAIRFLSLESYDYLMGLFWQHYNSYMHVIHQDAFHEDRENGGTKYYSPSLHICALAMGFRFADQSGADMQRITVSGRESTLHREAKYMLDYELERPGGIPS